MPRKPLPEITKPYQVPLVVDNKPLIKRSGEKASIRIHDHAHPLSTGEGYKRNPFWITLYGGGEFQVMKLARKEYPRGQVLDIETI